MAIQELSDSPKLIQELYIALKAGMQPESIAREIQLVQGLARNYNIDIEKAKSKIVIGHYDNHYQAFNYALEVAIAPTTDGDCSVAANVVKIIGNINNTPSIDGGEEYFSGGNYRWLDRKYNLYTGVRDEISASSIRGILSECGFTSSIHRSRRRKPCVFFINLLTPVPDWLGGAGKTKIDLRPYEDDIAKTVSSLAYKMPTYHGEGHSREYSEDSLLSYRDPSQIAIDYLREFLKDRYEKVKADPSLKTRDRLTQSGVFYRMRRIMIANGFEPPKDWGKTRTTLQNSIMKTCKDLWNDRVKREDLGIIAAARAVMLYDGQSYPVDIDGIKGLAHKGIAILVIEKEGIADVLAPFVEEYHIALVHTQGRFTEYGKDLVEEIKEVGSIVWTLTDYADGVDIAKRTRTPTPRIGIDRGTVRWLRENGYDIEEKDVEEDYAPKTYTDDEYLKHHRIELDSIVEKVGAEAFWEYILYRMQLPEFSPNRFNLTKVVTIPDDDEFYPDIVIDFGLRFDKCKRKYLEVVNEYLRNLLEGRKSEIEHELENHKLMKRRDKEDEIEEDLRSVVENDKSSEDRQRIETKFEKLVAHLDTLETLLKIEPDNQTESNDADNRHVDNP